MSTGKVLCFFLVTISFHIENSHTYDITFRLAGEGAKLWLDASRVSVAIKNAFSDACMQYYDNCMSSRSSKSGSKEEAEPERKEANGPAALHRPSPVGLAKALKNDAELEGMRQAHLRCSTRPLKFQFVITCFFLSNLVVV